jgi:hypothetical protein
MSHELEPTEPEGTEAQTASNDEPVEQSSATAADEQWWAGQRIENIITRLFRVTVVIVCLNMVIAGANVAMIATRWGSPRPAASPPPVQVNSAAPVPSTPTAAPAVPAPSFTPASQVAGGAPSPVAPPACAPPSAPLKEALPEKPVHLLGPPPSSIRSVPVLARSQLRTSVGFASRRPALPIPDEDDDDGAARPVERW